MQPEVLGRKVGKTGFGLLGFGKPTAPPEEEAFATLRAALAEGCNCWNGAEFYTSPGHNSMTLLRSFFEKYPEDAEKVVLTMKGGLRPGHQVDGSAAFVRESVENCLRMLGPKGKIDTFAVGRVDPEVPLAETLGTLAELVREGKIGGVALSEVSASTIREASKMVKIHAVEIELSLFCTDPLTNGILSACAELDIPILAYSPVGRGFLTGQIQSATDVPESDMRRMFPRFQGSNFEANLKLVKEVDKLAAQKDCTSAQLAIGWVRTLSKREGMPAIIPIPGTTRVERVRENAVEVELSEEEMREIDGVLGKFEVSGDRYPPAFMKLVNG